MSLAEKDNKYVWHPFTQHFNASENLEIIRGEGTCLYDANNKCYIDANSSWWVNTHGHGHPHIGQAINQQFAALDHTVFAGVTHPKAVELAERIVGHLPNPLAKVFYSDNGSTAVEVALKMAVQYWHNNGEVKKRFVALTGSYHGDTFGAMSVAQRGYFNAPFEPLFFDTDYLDFPEEENEDKVLDQASSYFSTGEIAGLIVEPLVQGAAGMKMYSTEFLDKLAVLAKEHNVLVIFDEVMTGFGRTGKLFAMDHCEIKPDLVALSKGLTAGVMAMGVTVASDEIFDAFLGEETTKALLHGHSFTANPIACAVACASLDLFEQEQTWSRINALIGWHEAFANQLEELTCVVNIRQQGTILAFEVETGEGNSYFSDIRTKAYQHLLNDGVLLRPLGNVIFFNPPYCITEAEYGTVQDSLITFLKSVQE